MMADRLTQLQEAVNQLSDYFCNSVGILQDTAVAGPKDSKGSEQEDKCALFSTLISRTVQDIDILIDSLPSHEYTQEKQLEILKKLEVENNHSAERLVKVVTDGECLLSRVRQALKEVTDFQLGIDSHRMR